MDIFPGKPLRDEDPTNSLPVLVKVITRVVTSYAYFLHECVNFC